MAQVIQAARKRNCLWPLTATTKGWATGTMADRYRAALNHLWLTPKGSYPWQPEYGTLIHSIRTQSLTDADMAFIREDLVIATAKWVPDITVLDIQVLAGELIGESDEKAILRCAWGILDATEEGSRGEPARFALGPYVENITI